MTIYNCDYCVCKDQQPEEIKRGVIVCQTCNKEVNPADIVDDYSTCEDLVPDDNSAYEDQREADQVMSYGEGL